MNGIFRKRDWLDIICSAACVFGIAFFLFIIAVDDEMAGEDFIAPFAVIFVSAIILALCIVSMVLKRRSYFTVNDGQVCARNAFGKKFSCAVEEVDYVFTENEVLTLIVGGRRYNAYFLKNSVELCAYIRGLLPLKRLSQTEREQLIEETQALKKTWRKYIAVLCVLCVLLFADIFLLSFGTGDKDFSQFDTRDWIFTAATGALLICVFIAMLIVAFKGGAKMRLISRKDVDISQSVMLNTPLPSGNVTQVFTTPDYDMRITVFGYPDDNSRYYSLEYMTSDYRLVKNEQSAVFQDEEEMLDDWAFADHNLFDITDCFEELTE